MKKNQLFSLLGIGAALLVPITSANAHFLWGSVTEGADRSYRMTISETPLEADDEHLEEARDTSAWVVGGKNLKLNLQEGFLAAPLAAADQVVAAGFSWGVFPDKEKKPYLLDLYAKTAVTEAAAAQSANLPVEVFARREGKNFVATVKSFDKVLDKAQVVVTTPDSKEEKSLLTDKKGNVTFPYTTAGLYTVRAIYVVTPRSGAHDGKRYETVHAFSTLTFPVAR